MLAGDLSPASESHHLVDKTEHSKTFCSPYKVKRVFREQETEYRGIAWETLGRLLASLWALFYVPLYLILIIDLPRLSINAQFRKLGPEQRNT